MNDNYPTTVKPVAIAVGHSRKHDQGAISVDGTSEWEYNSSVAIAMADQLEALGIPAVIYDNYGGRSSYTAAIDWLAAQLKNIKAQLVIELHFNSADGSARQEEYLYWHSSPSGRVLAQYLIEEHSELDPDPHTRGAKAVSSGRGSYFLRKTHCPAVITEPFFGDNEADWDYWRDKPDVIAEINVNAIRRFLSV